MGNHAYLSLLVRKAPASPLTKTDPLERLFRDPDVREYVSRFRQAILAERAKPASATGFFTATIDVPKSASSPEERSSKLKIAAHMALKGAGLRLYALREQPAVGKGAAADAVQCTLRFGRKLP